MPGAYVTIVTGTGTAPSVVERLRSMDHVGEAHVVAGDYDVIAELEGEDPTQLLPVVTREIGAIEGVGHTRTYVVLD
ncbi:MAG: Lrp/AsnC family transcriptional regulator [Halanaeroarchaeum sp.]